MDEDRRIRFLIPPFFLIFTVAFGIWLDPNVSLKEVLHEFFWKGMALYDPSLKSDIGHSITNSVFTLFASGSFIVFSGYSIGTISYGLLKLIGRCCESKNIEVSLKEHTVEKIRKKLNLKESSIVGIFNTHLLLGVIAEHALSLPAIHAWGVRRWNAFHLASANAVAILIGMAVCGYNGIYDCRFYASSFIAAALLGALARTAWLETMEAITLQVESDFLWPDPQRFPPKADASKSKRRGH